MATVVLVAGKMVQFRKYVIGPDTDVWEIYGDVAARAINSLAKRGKSVDAATTPEPTKRPGGRLVYFQAALPVK